MLKFMRTLLALALAAVLHAQDSPIQLDVDATDVTRRLIHVHMNVPAKPGKMTLLYPKWIPGEHSPTGPITDLVGLRIQAAGRTIPWRRDDVNMFAFHIEVPAGATALDVAFDFVSPPEAGGFSSGSSATAQLAVLNWNQLLLYPEGVAPDRLQYQTNLRVPNSWRYGTALPIARESGNRIEFQKVSLTTLVDSPLSSAAFYKTVDLGSDGGAAHYLHLAADSAKALEITPEQTAAYKNLVAETGALFGSRHYGNYHFLLTLSDPVAHFGLEHHESSDDRIGERSLVDEGSRRVTSGLLPHEFVHSWNGKYRRPAGLATGGFEQPMAGELLWVYEGLTEYLGEILTPRSGLQTAEDFRESLALTAARLDAESGRAWRPLEDTAVAAQLLYAARDDYGEYRRSTDYYPEGTLIWLDADVLIRQLSHGAKSLNDFCQAFHGGPGGAIALKTYTFADIVAGLNGVQPYDWTGFLNQRLRSTEAHAPLGGIQNGGWKLVYTAARSDYFKALEGENKLADFAFSIGLVVKEDGTVIDAAMGRPAQKAGVAPATKLIAVNNRQFTSTVLREAIQAAGPLELLVKDGEYYGVHKVEYRGGERYPHLERVAGQPDLLSQVIAPLRK
jgi:predicted metalloprotease with PDZ domain